METEPGNARTNCIGCHQHAGTDVLSRDVVASMPANGRARVRDTFPADYLWSITTTTEIGQMFKSWVDGL
jgi:hypothetical protein